MKIKSFDKAIMNEHFNIVLVFKFPIELIEFFWSRKYFLRCFLRNETAETTSQHWLMIMWNLMIKMF